MPAPDHDKFMDRIAPRGFSRDPGAALWHFFDMAKLNSVQIKAALPRVPSWKKTDATIRRTYAFKDFLAAMKFVNRAARLAEKACHHPDIDIRWNRVTLVLSTHDEGGLTEKDFALAGKLDQAADKT